MRRRLVSALALASALLWASCDEESPKPPPVDTEREVSMDFAATSFFAAPFPGEHLRRADGTVDVAGAPNPSRVTIISQIHAALEGIDGFGTTSSIHFRFDGPIDREPLPDARASLERESAILLVDVDPASPERGMSRPFDAFFRDDAGPFGDRHFLTLLPVQGVPLRPGTLYAAVLTDRLRGAGGLPVVRAPAMQTLLDGGTPEGLSEPAAASFRTAIEGLRDTGAVELDRVVALTAFRTADPLAEMRRAVDSTLGTIAPTQVAPLTAREVHDTYCVLEGTLRMPVFQEGTPPFSARGGGWVWREDGTLEVQREEDARVVVTLPRIAMPEAGFPLMVLIRTGAGGNRPLVDRGARAEEGGPPIAPGTGPALELARVGFAGISVEGPHGGSRNVSMGDEQFLVFNIQNPIALRDNLRQSALELVLLARMLDGFEIDASSCPDLIAPEGVARFDTEHVALFGHSMGASIAPLAAAFEPRFRALVLSGAGASWLENIVYKERPLATRPLAEALLGYARRGVAIDEDDPALGLLQWAGEAADAQVYAPLLVSAPERGDPRHVLMLQGIVDHYILPPIANPLSLALGLDRAGPGLDASDDRLAEFTPLESLLWLSERRALELPVAGNHGDGSVTAVVAQHFGDEIEDGHEAAFQTEPPKAQYRCFLRTFARDETPRVPDPAAPDPACE